MTFKAEKCSVIVSNKVLPHLYELSHSRVHRQMCRVDLLIDGHLLLPMPLAAREKKEVLIRVNYTLLTMYTHK